jgi:hypothetical protein
MHLCVRGDAFTSVPTTIVQLDCVTCSIILHSLLLFCFVFVLVKFFSIHVSLQTMDKVIRMVPIVPIKLYSHENNTKHHEISFAFFVFVLINVVY